MSKHRKPQAPPRNVTQPRDLDRWVQRATKLLRTADYPGVIAVTQRVLRAPAASPRQRVDAIYRKGTALMMLQQYDDAYATFTTGLPLYPNEARLWYSRGMAARYTTRFGQSLRDLEQAAALNADPTWEEQFTSELAFARSLVADELELRGPGFTLDQLIAQEELFLQAAQIMAQHRWAEAEALWRQNITMGDVLPQSWGNLGLCLLMQRQFDAAEAALRRALELDPDYAIARQNLAALPAFRATEELPQLLVHKAFMSEQIRQSLWFHLDD